MSQNKLSTGLGTLSAVTFAFVGMILNAHASPAENYRGVYQVPVRPELAAYARFEISDFNYSSAAGKLSLDYSLPIELTGIAGQRIHLEGVDMGQPTLGLSGPQGDATCARNQAQLQCTVRMKNIQINPNSIAALLKTQSSSQEEFNSKLEVAQSFSRDPIGIVTYFY
jgi:hypothetical protein